jgi:regulator of replication initiation timing
VFDHLRAATESIGLARQEVVSVLERNSELNRSCNDLRDEVTQLRRRLEVLAADNTRLRTELETATMALAESLKQCKEARNALREHVAAKGSRSFWRRLFGG